MNEQSNMPISSGSGGVSSWISTWMSVVTKPNEQTFTTLVNSSEAKATTAYIWVFIGSLISFFFASLVQGAVMASLLQSTGVDSGSVPTGVGGTLISAICGAPIAAVLSVVMFAIVTAIVQWVAKMFGGRGTFEQLAYALAAVYVPLSLVSGVLTLLSAIPYVGLCFSVISLGAALYALFLQVTAVKAVNQFGWGPAAGAMLLPVFVVACCLAATVAGLISLVAPALQNTINQGITP